MKRQNYPKGWNDARIGRVLKHYDSQSDADVAVEIAAAITLMGVPTALVSDVRELIARRSARARPKRASSRSVQPNKRRAAYRAVSPGSISVI